MSETSYLRLVTGSRITNYLGLQMVEGYKYTHPVEQERGYAYLQIPVHQLVNTSTGEVITDKASRNQHVLVLPACTVDVKGTYRFEVHPNPAFWEYGVAQGMYYLEPREDELVPGFYISLRKDLELKDMPEWAIRIYMRS